jgi:hypothetical protein
MNGIRFGQTLSKKVAPMIGGPFIVRYDNPLTTTLVIAAITVFWFAIINPKAGLLPLILGKQLFGLSNFEIDYLGAGYTVRKL